MSLFGTTSVVALLVGVIQTVTLNSEDFTGAVSGWSWNTPGVDDPGTAFTQTTGSTPRSTTGPNGGANPITRAVEPSNSYMYTEASDDAGSWTAESLTFDASLGIFTLTIDTHMRFGAEGLIDDGTTEFQAWNGSAWSTISNAIVGSQQTSADSPWRSSTEFGTYTSAGLSTPDCKFRVQCTKGASIFDANYDFAFDNAKITGPGLAPPMPAPPPTGTARAISILLANRVTNAQVAFSVQSPSLQSRTLMYRNLVEVTDLAITRMPFVIKTSKTASTNRLHVYHNTLKHIATTSQTTEGFGSHTIFFPFISGGIDGGTRVDTFRNNAIIFEDLDQGSAQPSSRVINNNVLANDDLAFWRANGGAFEGVEANLLLDAFFVPAGGSPLANAGAALPAGLPDSRSENTTVGAHEVGAVIDADWPRPNSEFFRDTAPPRWTEPGAA